MTRRTTTEATTVTDNAVAVIQENLAITPFEVTESADLATPLMGLRHALAASARANALAAAQEAGAELTPVEIDAMTQVEALRLVNGLDLTAVLLRAHYIMEIQRRGYLAVHPAHYGSLDEMARDNGMSITQLSQTLDMVNIIFPYVQNELGMPVYEFWEKLGSSKVKELLAVMKSIITGQNTDRAQTRRAVEAAMEEAADLVRTTRPDLVVQNPTDEQVQELVAEVRRVAVDNLITMAEGAPTVRAVRAAIRPARTPPVDIYEIPGGEEGSTYVLRVTPDQTDMLRNILGERASFYRVEAPPGRMATELRRIPAIRRILEAVNG